MFDFGIFISLICAISIFYFSFLLQFKKEDDEIQTDLSQNTKEYNSYSQKQIEEKNKTLGIITNLRNKRFIIEKKLCSLNIISLCLVSIVCVLYFLPSITLFFNNAFGFLRTLISSNIFGFIMKIFPFRKNFFYNDNFRISYITGSIIFMPLCVIWWDFLNDWLHENYIIQVIIILLLVFGLIWLNYFVSTTLACYITHYFIPLSVLINIIIYSVLCAIICLTIHLLNEYL